MASLFPGALTALLALTFLASRGPAEPQHVDFAVHCGTLHIGDGKVLTDVWMVVRNGKIDSISKAAPDPTLQVLEAGTRVVMPGIVAADTDLSRHGDDRYNVTPDFVALDGFDFLATMKAPLSGGVTTAYLSPGRARLVTGQGSVVKLHGSDLVARVLAEKACLRISLGSEGAAAPALFEPTPHPTSDNPLTPARQQVPTARISMLTELRRLFREARPDAEGLQGVETAAAEDRYSAVPLLQVVAGALPLRAGARAAADIRRALAFAGELGVRVVLEDPWEIKKVATFAAAQKAGAVFRVPYAPGALDPVNDTRSKNGPTPDARAPAAARKAGMTVALAPQGTGGLADYLLVAAVAIRHGLDERDALRAITLDAARILGVDQRVGSLEPGKDADFLVLSGAPFAVGTMVEQVYVDGEAAYTRVVDNNIIAIRCGKIMTGAGNTLRDGVLIVQDGRIKAVGEDLAIPYGAEIIDLPKGVMTPGFVDAYNHLGLVGDAGGVPNGEPGQRIDRATRPDDPMFRSALEMGLTTILVSGKDGKGPVAGRVAALKTGAADRDGMIVAAIAGIRFVHDPADGSITALKKAIDRGRKYDEAWQKYEKALADWKAGKGEKPAEEAPAPKEEGTADPLSGVWEIEVKDAPIPIKLVAVLKLEGSTVSGTVSVEVRGRSQEREITSGTFEEGQLTVRFAGMGGEAVVEGTVANDAMTGKVSMGAMGTFDFEGIRVSKDEEAQAQSSETSAATGDGSPTKPKVDESLEPFRVLFAGKATAVVRTSKAPAIRSILEYFAAEKLPFVLHGAKDALEDPALLGDTRPALLLDPDFVQRHKGKLHNHAAEMADREIPVALVSAAARGSRNLPLHASYAVRYGMSPQDALAAVTINPARMFKIDHRVGSLEKGKDADFVVFTGNPFDLTSRILLVGVNGRVVVDQRRGEGK